MASLSDATLETAKRQKRLRMIIAVLVGLVLLLEGGQWLARPVARAFQGSGGITGRVVNESGQPVPAGAVVLGTEIRVTADAQGNFTIPNAPSGPIVLVVGYQGNGIEIPLNVPRGGEVHLATIKLVSTLMPSE